MQKVLAIALLTWRAAYRYRLFWVVTVMLLLSVVALPLLLKDDGTARGFTQILLTYTLSTIATLLGLSTLWLACGTLARDIEECQMQVVATKPVARWQIWLGKWLGLLSLNAVLLAISGGCVYALLQWRASQLPQEAQETLRTEVMVARASAREASVGKEVREEAERRLEQRLRDFPVDRADWAQVRRHILEQVKAEYQVVPPGYVRQWRIDLSSVKDYLKDRPLQLRIKFSSADYSTFGTYAGYWQVGDPTVQQVWRSEMMSLAPETFHEFPIPANLLDPNGILHIQFLNDNNVALLFSLEEGMEVLYQQGGFAGNYLRGLAVIFCWMVVLATLGLTASSFLSFPVASFVTLGLLAMTLSSGTMSTAVSEGTIADWNAEKGTRGSSPLDVVVIPTFKAALWVINLAKDFSPVGELTTGRTISWGELGKAVLQMVVLLGGFLAAVGITGFTRRELAAAQGT